MSPAMTNAAITLASEVESMLGSFASLLDMESDAVQESDFMTFKGLQNDKYAMLSRYKALMETVKYQGQQLKGAGDTVTTRLYKASERLHQSAQRNARALERGSASMKRITDRIVNTARETLYADRQSYTRDGRSGLNASNPVSIRINEVL